MKKYECPVILIEDTVEEPMKFGSLMSAAHYLHDSDMSPIKPTKISIYTALLYAVKHNNRYKNYTIRLERKEVPVMSEIHHLKSILGFLSEEGVNNFNDCLVDEHTPYDFEEAKRLYNEHLFNLLAEMDVESNLDVVAELSNYLTRKFYYHPDNKYNFIKAFRYETYTSYIPAEDITVVWQDMWYKDECIQRSLIGFYYGEPDNKTTPDYSNMPLTAQFY